MAADHDALIELAGQLAGAINDCGALDEDYLYAVDLLDCLASCGLTIALDTTSEATLAYQHALKKGLR